MNTKTLILITSSLVTLLLCARSADSLPRLGTTDGRRNPNITVVDFKWKSGGAGRRAVFSEVTLRNNDETNYSEITLKARFVSWNGRPAGNVRGRLKRPLKAGEEKTFTDVRLGTMNFNADSVSLEAVGAREASDREAGHPLVVTGWDWRAGGYGGGTGTVASITVDNPSSVPYGKVEFSISQKRAGKEILVQSVRMKKIADANTETVYTNVNPGFVHPATDGIEVKISSAYPVSEKHISLIRGKLRPENAENSPDTEAAVPGYDIDIKEFEWGSGVAGSLGTIKSLVLRNRSGVRYKEITMSVEFLSRDGTVLTSNSFKIRNPPPPGKTAEFKNLRVGILSVSPNKKSARIFVKGGKPSP